MFSTLLIRRIALVAVFFSFAVSAFSQYDVEQEHDRLTRLGVEALDSKRFEESLGIFQRTLELRPRNGLSAYNIACTYSQMQSGARAAEWLQKAIEWGFTNLDHIEKDKDLEFLRKQPSFAKVVATLRDRPPKPAETAADMRLGQALQLVVMIEAEVDIGGTQARTIGAGILFGHKDGEAFIATANHVVRPGREAYKLRVMLRAFPGKWLEAKLMPQFHDQLDLAVISVGGWKELGMNFCALPLSRAGAATGLKRRQPVYPVGYPNALWGMPVEPDRISQVTADQISFQSAVIAKGHSGGALLTDRGDLIGMLRADEPPYGVAVAIESVLKAVAGWGYPVELRRSTPDAKTPLHAAVERGAIEETRALLNSCADPNAASEGAWTPLHEAAARQSPQATELLLSFGAEPYSWTYTEEKVGAWEISRDWKTPLHIAAEKGATEVVKSLLRQGMNANVYGFYRMQRREYVDWADKYTEWKNWSMHSTATPLHLAAENGSVEVVLALLGGGADFDLLDYDKLTALHWAAKRDSRDAARTLLTKGAKPNGVRDGGLAPLHTAAMHSAPGVAAVLIQHGANVNAKQRDHWNQTPLHYAAETTNPAVAKVLLTGGADANARGYLQRTPLHVAAEKGSMDVIKVLLAHGADANAVDERGRKPLHIAQEAGDTEKIKVLLGARAVPVSVHSTVRQHGGSDSAGIQKRMEADVEAARLLLTSGAQVDEWKDGQTPLHRAAAYGLAGMVTLLLRHRAELNAITADYEKTTALHLAAGNGQAAVVKLLIQAGANLEVKNKNGLTPLLVAVYKGDESCIQALVTAGANVHAEDDGSYANQRGTALLIAADRGPVAAVGLLLAAGALVSDRDDRGATPLHKAARAGSVASLELLLKGKAPVGARDKSGNTPLHAAAASRWDVFGVLLDAGADPNAQNEEGKTPLHVTIQENFYSRALTLLTRGAHADLADKAGNTPLHSVARGGKSTEEPLVDLLLKRGANVNARNMAGETPLAIAAKAGNDAIANFLRARGAVLKQ